MCHPEAAEAVIRTRAIAPEDMAAEDAKGSQVTAHMPHASYSELLLPKNVERRDVFHAALARSWVMSAFLVAKIAAMRVWPCSVRR